MAQKLVKLKEAKAAGFEAVKEKKNQVAEETKKELKSIKTQQNREFTKTQEENERVKKILETVIGTGSTQ